MNKISKIFGLCFLLMLLSTAVIAQKKGSKKAKKTTASTNKKKAKSNKIKNKQANAAGDDVAATENEQVQVGGGNASLTKDTTKPGELTITSSFKPSLRSAAKINFNATTPDLDTTKLVLNYNIPAQNLFFSYQPVAIKPLSLSADSSFEWQNQQYIKAGFGNFTTPYVETGLSFGHPNNTLLNIKANYLSSKGNVAFQEFAKANFNASASFGTIANHELVASLGYNFSSQYKYGVDKSFTPGKPVDKQSFNNIDLGINFQNKLPSSYGINYKPQLSLNLFADNNKATETSIVFNTPITKNINDKLNFSVTANADITSYKKDTLKLSNNVFSVAPSINFDNKILVINVGAKPSWNNSEFVFFPSVKAAYKLANEKMILEAGLQGYFTKNTYKSLVNYNPFIEQPTAFLNTKVAEQYLGIKGSIGKHISFNSQVSFLQFTNKALFVNDENPLNSQTFKTLYEPKLNALKIAAEVGYTEKEKLSIISSFSVLQFSGQDSFPKAYGIVPMELTTAIKYKILKDIFLKADLFLNTGNYYRVQTIQTEKTDAAFDLNIGAEYKIANKLNLYVDFNNLFNNQYQRWHQYQVLGLNVVAGVVYSFH